MLIVNKQQRFTVKNGPGILHGARFKIRHTNNVEFAEGIFNAVVLVVKLQNLRCITNGHRPQRLFVRSAADANRYAIGLAFIARKITHRHCHQIRGHFCRGRELQGVLVRAGPRSIGDDTAIGDGGIALVHDQRDIEGRLEGGFIKGRKGTARIGGLKLRGGVVPEFGFCKIEAAQLVIQNPGESDADVCRTGHELGRCSERGLLFGSVKADFGFLHAPALLNHGALKLQLGGIQRDGVHRVHDLHLNGGFAGKCGFLEIRRKGQTVVFRNNILRQALCHCQYRQQDE